MSIPIIWAAMPSNQTQILTDPTGSRRYIIIEIDREIDCSPIDHDQLYAQLKAMLSSEIVNVLKMRYHDEAKDIKPEKLARKLGGSGFEYDHKKEGHRYHVTYIQE